MKYRKHILAEAGQKGGNALCTGADGKDEILEVPIGTIARDFETNKVLFEIEEDGQEMILAKGGRGGKGNAFLKQQHYKHHVMRNQERKVLKSGKY